MENQENSTSNEEFSVSVNLNTNTNNVSPLGLLHVSDAGTKITHNIPHEIKSLDNFPTFTSENPSNHWSHDGTKIVVVEKDQVVVVDVQSSKILYQFPVTGAHKAYFSPTDRFLVTFRRFSSRYTDPNLNVFRLSDGKNVLHCEQRTWPALAWSRDDQFLVYTASTGQNIVVYRIGGESDTLEEAGTVGLERILGHQESETDQQHHTESMKRISSVAVGGRGNNPLVAICVQEPHSKAVIVIYRVLSLLKGKGKGKKGKPSARTELNQVDKCMFSWNPQGLSLLIRTASDVDTSHQSYYGHTALFLLPSVNTNPIFQSIADKDPIHDASWSPDGHQFVAVHGSPSRASLYSVKGKQTFDFGEAAHNTALWAPSGRFLLLGGFGNMSGAMTFWDVRTRTVLGRAVADSACEYGWAPDSQHVLAATTMPRMQVDNKIVVFHWTGKIVYERHISRLYHAEWQPVPEDLLPSPPSPRTLKQARRAHKEAEAAAPKKYTPPHARNGKTTSGSSSSQNTVGVVKVNEGTNQKDERTEKKNDNKNNRKRGFENNRNQHQNRVHDRERDRDWGRGRGRGKGRGRGRGRSGRGKNGRGGHSRTDEH